MKSFNFKLILVNILSVCIVGMFASILVPDHKTVQTKDGYVRGVRNKTLIKGIDFYSFKGIRYGQAPVGDLRFKVSVLCTVNK